MGLKKSTKDDKVPRDQQQWEAVTSLSLIDKKRELCHQKETRSGADQKVHHVEAMPLQEGHHYQNRLKKESEGIINTLINLFFCPLISCQCSHCQSKPVAKGQQNLEEIHLKGHRTNRRNQRMGVGKERTKKIISTEMLLKKME